MRERERSRDLDELLGVAVVELFQEVGAHAGTRASSNAVDHDESLQKEEERSAVNTKFRPWEKASRGKQGREGPPRSRCRPLRDQSSP